MATTDAYMGKNCPHCGAHDSLEADDARGEVACTNCARVVAMGLEENMLTRWEKDATFEDVDHHAGNDHGFGDSGDPLLRVSGQALSQRTAAAMAAGIILKSSAAADLTTEAGRRAKYAKTVLQPKMSQLIDNLCRVSRRGDDVRNNAISIAKTFVGHRREHGVKIERLSEVAAACFLLAAEMDEEPVPLAELRVLDPSLGNVERSRSEVVADTKMGETEKHLKAVFARNLMRHYIRMLHLQMSRYEPVCAGLLRGITELAQSHSQAQPALDLGQLSETERVVAAVLLARTEAGFQWEGKPLYDPAMEPKPTIAYDSFAANAHLDSQRVQRVMQIVRRALPQIKDRFEAIQAQQRAANETTRAMKRGREVDEASKTGGTVTDTASAMEEGLSKVIAAVKRERT